MKLITRFWRVMAAAGLALALLACGEKPFEKGGKAIDREVKKTDDQIKDMTK